MWIDYQEEDDKKQGRIVAGIATLLYALLILALLLLVRFTLRAPEGGGGLMIGYGDVESAAPGIDLPLFEEAMLPYSPPQTHPSEGPEEILTQDYEEAPAVVQPERSRREPDQTQQTNPTPQQSANPQTAVEQPRQVNPQALFPGQSAEGSSTSTGTGEGEGRQGRPDGDPNGGGNGTGTGGSGTGSGTGSGSGAGGTGTASLSGRSLSSALPRPDYGARDEGRVVVEIRVDRQGNVTSAAYRSVGSTTQNSNLVNAALRAARQARFNVDEDAPASQTGTITYIFKMQ